jgi:glycosyltransferase involved in cell wall biosynthesis
LQLSKIITTDLYDKNKINLIAVGRLAYQKGFDTLLDIMKQLDDRYHLTLLGDGPNRKALIQYIKDNNLQNKVTLKGFVDNPYPYMRQADIFVLSSRFEGFPNVVLESNACNTPVIAFDCPGGTKEIIVENKNGWLVECQNVKKFIDKLTKLDYQKQINNSFSKFKVEEIINQYESFFNKIIDSGDE